MIEPNTWQAVSEELFQYLEEVDRLHHVAFKNANILKRFKVMDVIGLRELKAGDNVVYCQSDMIMKLASVEKVRGKLCIDGVDLFTACCMAEFMGIVTPIKNRY